MHYESSDFPEVANDINVAVGDLSLEEIAALRNQLLPNEVVFVAEDAELKVYAFSDIEAWGNNSNIKFTHSDDSIEYPVNYWLNGEPSDTGFASERQALISAFESAVVE